MSTANKQLPHGGKCSSRIEEATPTPEGSMAGGSGGQGPWSVAACHRQGVGHPQANARECALAKSPPVQARTNPATALSVIITS